MEPLTVNIIIITIAIVSVWFQVKMWRRSSSPAFSLMAAAMLYLAAYRIALPIWPVIIEYGVALPAFVLFLAHTIYMYQLQTRLMKPKD